MTGLLLRTLCHLSNLCDAPEVTVVGIEISDGFALGTFDFGLLQLRRNCTNDACRHLILQVEDVVESTVESVRPEMRAGHGVNELPGDA